MPTNVNLHHNNGELLDDMDINKENMDTVEDSQPAKRSAVHVDAASQRQRLSRFPKGTVTRVRLHNFMTYNDVEFQPGPRLNLVLGPNGTGKSSLVCALCLGLAGGTKLLGRGDNVKEFIMRGKKEGWVEVSLSNGDGTEVTIRRDMKKVKRDDKDEKAESQWKINNVSNKRQKDVEELMRSLNIQLDNLCQFLPQDKVVEFARLTPCELLAETEKAIGDAKLYKMHNDLIRRNVEMKEAQADKSGQCAHLERLRKEQERQGPEYERFQKKAALANQVALLKKKVALIEVEEKTTEYQTLNQQYKAVQEEYRQHKAAAKQEEGPLKALQEKVAKYKSDVAKKRAALEALKRDTTTLEKAAVNLDHQITQQNDDLNDLQKQSDERKARIEGFRHEAAVLQQELSALPHGMSQQEQAQMTLMRDSFMEKQDQVVSADSTLEDTRNELRDCEERIRHWQGQLTNMNNITELRLRAMEHRNRGIRSAYAWVKQNLRAFRGEVYGPIAVEIQVADPQYAKYVETQVNYRWMTAFVTTNREDETILTNHFRSHGMKFAVICYTSSDLNTPIRHPLGEAQQYGRFDMQCVLDEVVEGPLVVKKALDEHTGISSCYVGTLNTKRYFPELQQAGVRQVYTPDTKVSFSRSQYSSAQASSYGDIKQQLDFLRGAVDQGKVADLQQEIQLCYQERERLQQEESALSILVGQRREEMDAINQAKTQLTQAINARAQRWKTTEARLTAKKQQLQYEERQEEPLDRRDELREGMERLADQLHVQVKKLVLQLHKQWSREQDLAATSLCASEAEMMEAAVGEKSQEAVGRVEGLRKAVTEVEKRLKVAQQAMGEAKSRAESKGALDEAIQADLAAISPDLAQIQEEIRIKREEMDNLTCSDDGIAARFEDRAKKIRDLQVEVENGEQHLQQLQAGIEKTKEAWLPELKQMITGINHTFSANFSNIACAGEVVLKDHEDYDKYAIEIRVKFREGEDLQVLTAQRQSGGERSVATILYLIALQGITVTPFRVVDEINQGMDPQNERAVYTQLVTASTKPGTPQCFLLTPKLLPDLSYNEHITVLEIFNGREIDKDIDKADVDALMFGTRHMEL